VGLVHRFTPKATLLTYFTYQKYHNRDSIHSSGDLPGFPGFTFAGMDSNKSDREFYNLQVQQNLVLGNHNLFGGVDYFDGYRYQQFFASFDLFFGGFPLGNFPSTIRFRPPERTYSFYLFDYWRIHPSVLLELGVIKDFAKNARDTFSGDSAASFYRSMWSPIFGINWQVNPQHTLRFALQRHLITHQGAGWQAATLLPTDTAGFPWLITSFNSTEVRQVGAAWEAQWDPKTFTVLKLQAQRSSFAFFQPDTGLLKPSYTQLLTWKEYQGSLVLNRILSPSWGLAVGALGKRVLTDSNDIFLDGRAGSPAYDHFTEFRGFFTLSFLHRTGWQGLLRSTLIQPYFKDRADSAFGLVDLKFGKEFAHKRGLATIEVTNLFDRRFAHPLEPFFEPEFYAGRRILGKLAFYF
jgi:hypothetical protein